MFQQISMVLTVLGFYLLVSFGIAASFRDFSVGKSLAWGAIVSFVVPVGYLIVGFLLNIV